MGDIIKKKIELRPVRRRLMFYDLIAFFCVSIPMLMLHPSSDKREPFIVIIEISIIGALITILFRYFLNTYKQIWRYGGLLPYLYLILADVTACVFDMIVIKVVPAINTRAILIFSIHVTNLVLCMSMRMLYALLYENASVKTKRGAAFRWILKYFGNVNVNADTEILPIDDERKIRTAIIGAGRLGASLAEDMRTNSRSAYVPVCFVDKDLSKGGRTIRSIPIFTEKEFGKDIISNLNIQQIIIALPHASAEQKKNIYEKFKPLGCRVSVYDYPIANDISSGKLAIRDFAIEELLPRRTIEVGDAATSDYYSGKRVLVTGGGGSIGSELCRQIAAMAPEQLIILDIAENTTYNLQQELVSKYKNKLNLAVEICSVIDIPALENVFDTYKPQIVIHAAAHKHVPLMEHNCVRAVKNNIFGTKNTVETAVKYNVEKFVLVSSDKAVNPTNVMGATKRFCEYLVLRHSFGCAVRFGNVMGSAGSVIPLFKRQIAKGGPLTITDKRIIRYFMTISEASHLILECGAKAASGQLYVLDMGQPVKILDLAEEMIRLSGYIPYEDIDIIETGLRPGEKLYEELLVKSATLGKTDNRLIFTEKDELPDDEKLNEKLDKLKSAVLLEDDEFMRKTMKEVVPTYKSPEEVNARGIILN